MYLYSLRASLHNYNGIIMSKWGFLGTVINLNPFLDFGDKFDFLEKYVFSLLVGLNQDLNETLYIAFASCIMCVVV